MKFDLRPLDSVVKQIRLGFDVNLDVLHVVERPACGSCVLCELCRRAYKWLLRVKERERKKQLKE